jgi:hypothetical protein
MEHSFCIFPPKYDNLSHAQNAGHDYYKEVSFNVSDAAGC